MKPSDTWISVALCFAYVACAIALDVYYLADTLGSELSSGLIIFVGVFVIHGAQLAPDFLRGRGIIR